MSFPSYRPFPGPSVTSRVPRGAVVLLADEWNGLTIDFTDNTYAMRVSLGSEGALGGSPYNPELGASMDFTDNSYVVSA